MPGQKKLHSVLCPGLRVCGKENLTEWMKSPSALPDHSHTIRASFPWLMGESTICSRLNVPDPIPYFVPPTNSHSSVDDGMKDWWWTCTRGYLWTMSFSHTTWGFHPCFTTSCLLSMCLKSLNVSLLICKMGWWIGPALVVVRTQANFCEVLSNQHI